MNEKLKMLAQQVWPDENIDHTNHMKFANLIIQQCILAVEMKTNIHHIHTTFDESMVLHTIENSSKAIKQHFGIEE